VHCSCLDHASVYRSYLLHFYKADRASLFRVYSARPMPDDMTCPAYLVPPHAVSNLTRLTQPANKSTSLAQFPFAVPPNTKRIQINTASYPHPSRSIHRAYSSPLPVLHEAKMDDNATLLSSKVFVSTSSTPNACISGRKTYLAPARCE
jgi:hypothetical protein